MEAVSRSALRETGELSVAVIIIINSEQIKNPVSVSYIPILTVLSRITPLILDA